MSNRNRSHYRKTFGWAAVTLVPLAAAMWSEAAPAAPPKTAQTKKAPVQAAAPTRKAGAKPAGGGNAKPGAGTVQYNRDVRPILADNCFACHGPDSAARKADLRLDRREDALARSVFVPGKPDASALVARLITKDSSLLMPPPSSHKKLTAQQIDTLKRWIAQGATYERHWSYIPPTRPALPAVKDKKWSRNPIDRFVLAKLEAAGLKPALEADRRTLARRLSLDLTGLPPDPADVERFVKDKSPNAYEKLVDKFLASPHWGEHRGRYWLDAARYADTHGIHFDNYREIWAYRDWVIRAFNRNLPFDQFTIEQLAGDLLPKPTVDQLVATGFNRCNITTNEGGVIPEEYLVLYTRDRTETTAAVWMGATAGCATCHDHKFDPLSQREFYEMAAFFNNTTQGAMDGNIKDTPPIIAVPKPEDRERFDALQKELQAVRMQSDARKQAARADFEQWLNGASALAVTAQIPKNGLRFHAPLDEGKGKDLNVTVDGRAVKLTAAGDPGWIAGQVAGRAFQRKPGADVQIPEAGDFEKDQGFTCSAWVRLPSGSTGGAIIARMDDQNDFRGWDLWVEGNRIGTHIINKWPEDALKVVMRDRLRANQWYHVTITYNGGAKPDSVKIYVDGEPKPHDAQANALKSTIRTKVPLKIAQRHTTSHIENLGVHDIRLYDRSLSEAEVEQVMRGTRAAWLASRGAKQLSPKEKDELFNWWLPALDDQYKPIAAKLTSLESEDRNIRARGTIAHVANEKNEAAMAYILFRGEYDQRKDPVKADTPDILPAMPPDFPKNRLGFAKWLLLPEHPLTTRVTVNRFWQELFGTGLVATTGDFGITGELPSHPELLDWMAVEFREGGWDVKKFFKLLVTSATYRQSAVTTPEKRLKDRANRLLSRGPRFRMDAEVIRDYALAASGLLVPKLGGPSVKPYQPEGVWEAVAMIGSNTRDYRRDTGENLYRRSMYTFWKRSAPPASMDIFNAPSRETCTVRRERTNTPLQALVTLNDPQFVEAARHLAQRALKEGGATVESRVNFLALRLLARPLRPEEMTVVKKSVADLEAYYKSQAKDAVQLITVGESKADASIQPELLAAWTMVTNQLMNLDEVLNK